jgi:hypothetical protein
LGEWATEIDTFEGWHQHGKGEGQLLTVAEVHGVRLDLGDADLGDVGDVEHLAEGLEHFFATQDAFDAEVAEEVFRRDPGQLHLVADTLLTQPLFQIKQELVCGTHAPGGTAWHQIGDRRRVALELL